MVEQSVSKESMIMNNIKFSKNEVIIIRLSMGSIPIYSTSIIQYSCYGFVVILKCFTFAPCKNKRDYTIRTEGNKKSE